VTGPRLVNGDPSTESANWLTQTLDGEALQREMPAAAETLHPLDYARILRIVRRIAAILAYRARTGSGPPGP